LCDCDIVFVCISFCDAIEKDIEGQTTSLAIRYSMALDVAVGR